MQLPISGQSAHWYWSLRPSRPVSSGEIGQDSPLPRESHRGADSIQSDASVDVGFGLAEADRIVRRIEGAQGHNRHGLARILLRTVEGSSGARQDKGCGRTCAEGGSDAARTIRRRICSCRRTEFLGRGSEGGWRHSLSHWNVLRNRWSSAAGCSTPTVRRPSPCATFPSFSKGSAVYAVQPATLTLPVSDYEEALALRRRAVIQDGQPRRRALQEAVGHCPHARGTLPSRMETMLHAIVSNRSGRRSRNSLRLRSDRAVLPNCAMPRPMVAGTGRFMNRRQRRAARYGSRAAIESCSWRKNRKIGDDPGEEREPQITPALRQCGHLLAGEAQLRAVDGFVVGGQGGAGDGGFRPGCRTAGGRCPGGRCRRRAGSATRVRVSRTQNCSSPKMSSMLPYRPAGNVAVGAPANHRLAVVARGPGAHDRVHLVAPVEPRSLEAEALVVGKLRALHHLREAGEHLVVGARDRHPGVRPRTGSGCAASRCGSRCRCARARVRSCRRPPRSRRGTGRCRRATRCRWTGPARSSRGHAGPASLRRRRRDRRGSRRASSTPAMSGGVSG